ncbi:MAG TPA: hypothetical protein VGS19_01230 [Streptosporangiaceae bacterium]|nr:hypothetical protein [Streptosporangiaceae bacterium]
MGTPPAASTPPVPAATLVLINGERAMPGSAAGVANAAIVRPAGTTGVACTLVTLRMSSGTYLVPGAALPYLGRGLDPRLFELSALQRAERGGRLPISLRYHGTLHALPGVTVTQRGAGTADGYLTASSAVSFGAALVRQFTADHSRGSYGSDGLFGGGLSISLPGTPLAPARHGFPMHTLTVTGTNLAGQPDTGDTVMVVDATDPARFGDPSESQNDFYHGTAKFSVPSGTYWAIGEFRSPSGWRLDVLPQFTVQGDTTVGVSEHAATSQVRLTTPRQAITQDITLSLVRGGRHGTFGVGFSAAFNGAQIWVNPVSTPPSAGTLQAYTSGDRTSSPGVTGVPYKYTLDFVAPPGTIPPQHHTVSPGSLATVDDTFYQDVRSTGAWVTAGGTALQMATTLTVGYYLPLGLPGQETQYLTAHPVLWDTEYYEIGNGLAGGGQSTTSRLFQRGEHPAEDWNAYPLHPAPSVSLPGTRAIEPSAVRRGNTLLLSITPFGDNTPGHTSSTGFSAGVFAHLGRVTGSYALYQNGTKIAAGNAVKNGGFFSATLNAAPSTIRYVLTASRTGQQWLLSTGSRDVWTWPSRPAPKATVPAPWFCGVTVVNRRLSLVRHCAVEAMLVPRYQVAGLTLQGSTQPGPQALTITISHLQQATAWPITQAKVEVSYDNGATWQPVTLIRTSAGQFRATYTAPASAGVSLRVSARDAHGATVTETIDRAYQTAS